MSKRPTDHLQPAAKKRTKDRQLTKDDESEEDEEELNPGSFQRAPEDVLKARRIVKARRGGEVPTATSAGAPVAANPFASISLTIPGKLPAQPMPPLVASEPLTIPEPVKAPSEDTPKVSTGATQVNVPEVSASTTAQEPQAAGDKTSGVEPAEAKPSGEEGQGDAERDDAIKDNQGVNTEDAGATAQVASATGGFTSFAASTSAPFALAAGTTGGFSFGGGTGFGNGTFGAAKLGGGFGSIGGNTVQTGDGGAATVQPFSFSSTSASGPTFSFATPPASGGFPALQTVFGGAGSGSPSLFGSSLGTLAPTAPKMPLPDEQKQVTGEEEERSVFASEGVLFQLEDGQWKERGRGEMRCNLAPSGQARLVMRQRGNLRLLLNANLWPDMKVITMDGNKGVTFAVINAAKSLDEAGKEGEGAEDNQLHTYAFRIKAANKLAEFTQVVDKYKAGEASKGEEQSAV